MSSRLLTVPDYLIKKSYGTGDSYETPDDLYNALDNIFNFGLDAFASPENKKHHRYFSEENSALTTDWQGQDAVWMNPPYSKNLIGLCMKKAMEQSLLFPSMYIVALVRDDPTTNWHENYIDGVAPEIWRLKKRVKFKGAKSCYNFPCCLVIYNQSVFNQGNGKTITSRWWYE